jgi:hypothetical protein
MRGNGASDRTRTGDIQDHNLALYQLSYARRAAGYVGQSHDRVKPRDRVRRCLRIGQAARALGRGPACQGGKGRDPCYIPGLARSLHPPAVETPPLGPDHSPEGNLVRP